MSAVITADGTRTGGSTRGSVSSKPARASSDAAEHAQTPCSIQATLDIVGDRWTLLILRDLFRGVRRFSAMQHDLGIARNMLADRLSRLTDADVVAKVPYQHRPIRYDYVLTPKGLDLSNSLLALMAWGDRWCQEGDAPTVLVHADCGTALEIATRCPACDEAVSPTRIRSLSGRSDASHAEEHPGGDAPGDRFAAEPRSAEPHRDKRQAANSSLSARPPAARQHPMNGGAL